MQKWSSSKLPECIFEIVEWCPQEFDSKLNKMLQDNLQIFQLEILQDNLQVSKLKILQDNLQIFKLKILPDNLQIGNFAG